MAQECGREDLEANEQLNIKRHVHADNLFALSCARQWEAMGREVECRMINGEGVEILNEWRLIQ